MCGVGGWCNSCSNFNYIFIFFFLKCLTCEELIHIRHTCKELIRIFLHM